MSGSGGRLSVVAPLYRSPTSPADLVRRVAAALDAGGESWELLLVDDASPDDTLAAARAAASAEPRCGVVALARNLGQQGAVLVGLDLARGEHLAVLDGDLQDPPEALPALLAALRTGPAEVVFAGRRGRYQSAPRMLTSRLYRPLRAAVCRVPADAGLFFVMSRRGLAATAPWRAPRPWILPMIGLAGVPVVSLPVERHERPRGSSSYSGRTRLAAGVGCLWFAARQRWFGGIPGRFEGAAVVAERLGAARR